MQFYTLEHHPMTPEVINPRIEKAVVNILKAKFGHDTEVANANRVKRVQNRDTFSNKIKSENPNFKSRQATGEIIVAPYTVQNVIVQYEDTAENSLLTYRYRDFIGWLMPSTARDWYGEWVTDLPDWWEGLPVFIGFYYYTGGVRTDCQLVDPPSIKPRPALIMSDEVKKTLVTQAFAEINSNEWDALTSIAEAKETVKFLADKLVAAARLVCKLRNPGQLLGGTKGLVGKTTAQWLEYRYAIMPLVFEIEDIASALENLGRIYNKVSSKSHDVIEGSIDETEWAKDFDEILVKYSVSIKRRYDPSTILSATSHMVGLNPFVTAWELIPFSFVIDWFVNIGDLLAATTHIPDYCDQGATFAINVQRSARYERTSETNCGRVVTSAKLLERSYYRSVVDSSEAGFQFSPDLSWRRYLDAFALTWSDIRKVLNSNQLNHRVLQ